MSKSTLRPIVAVAAFSWLVVAGYGLRESLALGSSDNWEAPYAAYAIALLLGSILTVVAVWGASGPGGRYALRWIGLAVCALGVLSTVVAWALPLWMTIFAVGYGLVAWSGSGPWRRSVAYLAAAPLLGMAALFIGLVAELGPRNEYGDHPAASGVALVVTGVATLVSLYQLDRSVDAAEPSIPARAQGARP